LNSSGFTAGEHHFSGEIVAASQRSGRKKSEQLLQEFSDGHKNAFFQERGPSLQQNQLGQGEGGVRGKQGRRTEHPDVLNAVSLDSL